jgi:hypothetical protein
MWNRRLMEGGDGNSANLAFMRLCASLFRFSEMQKLNGC